MLTRLRHLLSLLSPRNGHPTCAPVARLARPPLGVPEHVIEEIVLDGRDGGPVYWVWLVRWVQVGSFDTLDEAGRRYPDAEVRRAAQ